jgi:hypothetical protein
MPYARDQRLRLKLNADANPEIGAGHVMRLANLVEAWLQLGIGDADLAGLVTLPFVQKRLNELGIASNAAPVQSYDNVITVTDSYDVQRRRDGAIGTGALRVLVDDLGGEVSAAYDVIWNPNAYGGRDLYPDFRGEVLSGAGALSIRSDLPAWRSTSSGTIGVMLGGGRPAPVVLDGFRKLAAIVGEEHFGGVGEWTPPTWKRFPPNDPWNVLCRCDVLISTAGTAIWEAAAVGIPVVVIKTAINQDKVFRWAVSAGAPGYDATSDPCAGLLTAWLLDALTFAKPLPPVLSGVKNVALALSKLAYHSGAKR